MAKVLEYIDSPSSLVKWLPKIRMKQTRKKVYGYIQP